MNFLCNSALFEHFNCPRIRQVHWCFCESLLANVEPLESSGFQRTESRIFISRSSQNSLTNLYTSWNICVNARILFCSSLCEGVEICLFDVYLNVLGACGMSRGPCGQLFYLSGPPPGPMVLVKTVSSSVMMPKIFAR